MYNHIRDIFVFTLQLFADFMSDKVCIFKWHIRLDKQMHINLDISHAPTSPDFMASLYAFNCHNQVANFFLFNSGHIQKDSGTFFNNPVPGPENNKSNYYGYKSKAIKIEATVSYFRCP